MYDVPQLRCVESVDTYAASMPAIMIPRNPAGRNLSIAEYAMSCPTNRGSTYGKVAAMSETLGKMIIDDSATMIHGHGRKA